MVRGRPNCDTELVQMYGLSVTKFYRILETKVARFAISIAYVGSASESFLLRRH